MSTVQIITVDEDHLNQRLDNFLITRLKGVPKSHLYRLLRKGEVRVNKKRVKPDYRLQPGDQLRLPPLRLPEKEEGVLPKPSISIKKIFEKSILFENAEFMIINKPAGIAVHGGSGIKFGVIETFRQLRPQQKFLELVHRLDRETSGCLLIAKKSSVLKKFHEMLREGSIEKTYLVLVKGHWPNHLKEMEAPLKKQILSSGERIVKVDSAGKNSLTHFKVIRLFDSASLVEAKPRTGRTHQIRVHALYAGHPVAADEKYGDKEFNKILRKKGLKRLFLHAKGLAFRWGEDHQLLKFEAELEKPLLELLESL